MIHKDSRLFFFNITHIDFFSSYGHIIHYKKKTFYCIRSGTIKVLSLFYYYAAITLL